MLVQARYILTMWDVNEQELMQYAGLEDVIY